MATPAGFSLTIAFVAQFFMPHLASAQTASASIQVTVAQPQPVAAGTNFDYVVEVSNEGPADAANPTLTFPLPSGVSFQSDVVPPGWSCNSIPAGTLAPTLTCSAPTLPPGTVFFTITASTPPTAVGTFSTTATVSSTTPDPDDNDNSANVDVIIATQSDFSMALAASPNPVNAGANLTWTMTVTNHGPSTGMIADASLPLPPSTTFVSVSAPPGWSCVAPPVATNGTVTCSLTGTLNVSATAVLTVVSNVTSSLPAGSTISGTATVSSADDLFPINDSASASVQSAILFDAGITKTLTPSNAFPGLPLQYTIAVTNNGPSDASSVTLTDVLPAALRFASLSVPGGWSCVTPSVGANGTVSCSIPSLTASAVASFTLNVTIAPAATAGTPINNTATVATLPGDTNGANNSATATGIVATPPNVTATKSVAGGSGHPEGSTVTYTIVLSNSGSLAQGDNPGNELTDVLPSTLTLVSATATSGTAVANIPGNTVTWNGAIAGGGNVTVTIQAIVKSGTLGSTISNSASISFDSDANGTNDATRTSDDPSTAAASDPTAFLVVAAVPALSSVMLILLAAALAAMALIVMRSRIS
jgi:conserved repeat domain/conserved repeat domain/conserved repeat domain